MVRRLVSTGWHWQYGWLRRPELDDSAVRGFVYERADGDLVVSSQPRHEKAMLLNLWEDDDGAMIFRASVVPRELPARYGARPA